MLASSEGNLVDFEPSEDAAPHISLRLGLSVVTNCESGLRDRRFKSIILTARKRSEFQSKHFEKHSCR